MATLEVTVFVQVLLSMLLTADCSSRNDRVWPLSGSKSVDLPQSSPFGPRLKISANSRYDFHRGVDMPADSGTPIYAIDEGVVIIAGNHTRYYDALVQIRHTTWEEEPGCQSWDPAPSYTCRKKYYYSNYMHVGSVAVSAGMEVNKGQLIGHTGRDGRSGFPHLHFEIRAGRSYQAYCCNPWKYLPNTANTYSSFTADVTLTPKYNSAANQFEAEVNVSVPPDQLTLNRIEVHVMTHSGSTYVRKFDFCEDNFSHTLQEMDDPMFEGNLLISPNRFNSRSFEKGEKASISFLFKALPSEGGTVYAKAYDVFGNVITSQNTY